MSIGIIRISLTALIKISKGSYTPQKSNYLRLRFLPLLPPLRYLCIQRFLCAFVLILLPVFLLRVGHFREAMPMDRLAMLFLPQVNMSLSSLSSLSWSLPAYPSSDGLLQLAVLAAPSSGHNISSKFLKMIYLRLLSFFLTHALNARNFLPRQARAAFANLLC